MRFKSIAPKALEGNVFQQLDERWMLLTAGTPEESNTMTVSWGGLGVLWNLPVATCYVRPQRHTFAFMEDNDTFTLSVYPEEYRKALAFCGSKSGRDYADKAAECGLTVQFADCGAPYYAQAELVLVCRKLYWQDFDPNNFLDAQIEKHYPIQDYHRIYIGEILEVLIKED